MYSKLNDLYLPLCYILKAKIIFLERLIAPSSELIYRLSSLYLKKKKVELIARAKSKMSLARKTKSGTGDKITTNFKKVKLRN